MSNKTQRLTTIGVILLLIGASFLVGAIYRSTYNHTGGSGIFPNTTTPVLLGSQVLPPRTYVVELDLNYYVDLELDVALDASVDVYLLDSKGRDLWLSEATIEPVWFTKDVSDKETLSIKIPYRDNYSLLLTSDKSTMSGLVHTKVSGYESDLLWFSLIAIVMGLVITIVSKIMLQNIEKGSTVALKKDNTILAPKEIMPNTAHLKIVLDKSKAKGQLRKLLVWEFEEYLAFPMLEIVMVVAFLTVLTPTIIEILPVFSYNNLLSDIQTVFLFLIFVAGVLFCHSYAGSCSKGETKMLLSYPVKRSNLFLSKFIALFTTLFVIYAGAFALQISLLSLNPFEPMLYTSLLLVALQLFLVCTIATALSVVTKNELLSILTSALLLFGIENFAPIGSLVTFTGRFTTGFTFIRQQIHGILSSVSLNDVLASVFAVLGVSILLFVLSYVYFTRKMEID